MVIGFSRHSGQIQDNQETSEAVQGDAMSHIVNRATAEHYIWGGVSEGWHLVKTPGLSVIQERVPPGASETRHSHRIAQQFFYILSGTATFEYNGDVLVLQAGDGVSVPPGAVHQFRNEGDTDVHFLVISQPPSHGDRITDSADA